MQSDCLLQLVPVLVRLDTTVARAHRLPTSIYAFRDTTARKKRAHLVLAILPAHLWYPAPRTMSSVLVEIHLLKVLDLVITPFLLDRVARRENLLQKLGTMLLAGQNPHVPSEPTGKQVGYLVLLALVYVNEDSFVLLAQPVTSKRIAHRQRQIPNNTIAQRAQLSEILRIQRKSRVNSILKQVFAKK